jgi:hypothetical protein
MITGYNNKKTHFAHEQKRSPFNIERPSRPSVSVLSAQSRIRRESLTVLKNIVASIIDSMLLHNLTSAVHLRSDTTLHRHYTRNRMLRL